MATSIIEKTFDILLDYRTILVIITITAASKKYIELLYYSHDDF